MEVAWKPEIHHYTWTHWGNETGHLVNQWMPKSVIPLHSRSFTFLCSLEHYCLPSHLLFKILIWLDFLSIWLERCQRGRPVLLKISWRPWTQTGDREWAMLREVQWKGVSASWPCWRMSAGETEVLEMWSKNLDITELFHIVWYPRVNFWPRAWLPVILGTI